MLLAAAPAEPPRPPAALQPPAPTEWSQVTIEQRVIIRIPTMRRPSARASLMAEAPPPPAVRLREGKGPKCLPIGRIRGAVITMLNGVTMITDRNEQLRAHFGKTCRTADFYAGFYIEPRKDGSLCAGRDTLHARNGSSCEIEKFSRMIAEPVDDEDDR